LLVGLVQSYVEDSGVTYGIEFLGEFKEFVFSSLKVIGSALKAVGFVVIFADFGPLNRFNF
jgi:hypothetical protein